MAYHHTEAIESAMVSLLPPILQVADSQFGFLAEVCYSLGGEPYLLSHAVIDIYKPNYTHQDILSNLQFHNLDTLNGAVMTSKGPVLSNDPKNDPRSGGRAIWTRQDKVLSRPAIFSGRGIGRGCSAG